MLSSPEHVECAARFSTKSTGAEAITARVNVVVKPFPPIPLTILSIILSDGNERDRNNIDNMHRGQRS
jgi:hypothetical protein